MGAHTTWMRRSASLATTIPPTDPTAPSNYRQLTHCSTCRSVAWQLLYLRGSASRASLTADFVTDGMNRGMPDFYLRWNNFQDQTGCACM